MADVSDKRGAEVQETEDASGPMLSRRAALRLAGIAGAGAVLASGIGIADASIPAADVVGDSMYDYAYLRDKFKSPEFAIANRRSDSLLCFGSSEFQIKPTVVAQVPQAVFGGHDYGLDLWFVGEGYDQSLWHAIAFGAYAARLDEGRATGLYARGSRKVAFFVSPQWFFEGGVPANATRSLFSYHLWQGFCSNPNVPSESISYVKQRLGDLGIESLKLRATTRQTIPDHLNDLVLGADDALKVRMGLMSVRSSGGVEVPDCKRDPTGSEGIPDWDALWAAAVASGTAACTTNDYYIYDDYWNKHNASDYAAGKLAGFFKGRSFLKAPTEDADLACALEVANACSLEVKVVLLPVPGSWYDYEGFSYDDRQQRYALVRDACSKAGVSLADLTSYEYEPYFTCDGTHLGWTGWVAAEKALYEFARGE